MGIYTEYLDRNLDFAAVESERKKQLRRLCELRGRHVLVIAADLNNSTTPTGIDYSDILPINDQLSLLPGGDIDVILETPGGSGEVVEDVVRLIRTRHDTMSVIVAGWAKSAGTIMAMAANEILMEPASALGPIDAQIQWQGKRFSADALLEGVNKIKEETTKTGALNKAYIPILQGISPGELESANNALEFAKSLVETWLADYKFKTWVTHSSTGAPVTDQDRHARAREVAERLCNHKAWRTHARSIKVDDLRAMRLLITDYSTDPDLSDAIRRYHTLMQMTFAFGVYKIVETSGAQIYRFQAAPVQQPKATENQTLVLDVKCKTCNTSTKVQVNVGAPSALKPGLVPFPADSKLECPSCKKVVDLSPYRAQIEAQTGKPIVI